MDLVVTTRGNNPSAHPIFECISEEIPIKDLTGDRSKDPRVSSYINFGVLLPHTFLSTRDHSLRDRSVLVFVPHLRTENKDHNRPRDTGRDKDFRRNPFSVSIDPSRSNPEETVAVLVDTVLSNEGRRLGEQISNLYVSVLGVRVVSHDVSSGSLRLLKWSAGPIIITDLS